MRRYRYYCKTEGKFKKRWTDIAPTECDDPSHELNLESISYDPVSILCSVTPLRTKATNKNYELVATFIYPGSDFTETIQRSYVIAALKDDSTTGSLRLYDATNGIVLSEVNVESSIPYIVDLGEPINVPSDPAVLELHAKTSKLLFISNMTIVY